MLLTLAERWGGDPGVYPAFAAGYGKSFADDAPTPSARRAAQRGGDTDARARRPHRPGRSGRGPAPPALLARRPRRAGVAGAVAPRPEPTDGVTAIAGALLLEGRVRRIGDARVGLGAALQHRLGVREDSKPASPWYAPIPLAPTPPNGRSGTARCSSVWLTVTPPADVCSMTRSIAVALRAEHVQRQRLGAIVDEARSPRRVVVREHRQDRAEDLVVHHRRVGLDAGEHGRSEVALGDVVLAADRDLCRSRRRRAGRSAGRGGVR